MGAPDGRDDGVAIRLRRGRPTTTALTSFSLAGPSGTVEWLHPARVAHVAGRPRSSMVAALDDDGVITIWDQGRGTEVTLPGNDAVAMAVGESFVYAGRPGRVDMYEGSGTPVGPVAIPSGNLQSLAAHPLGFLAVVDGRIVSGGLQGSFFSAETAEADYVSVAVGPDGLVLARTTGWFVLLRDKGRHRIGGSDGWIEAVPLLGTDVAVLEGGTDERVGIWSLERTETVWHEDVLPPGNHLVAGSSGLTWVERDGTFVSVGLPGGGSLPRRTQDRRHQAVRGAVLTALGIVTMGPPGRVEARTREGERHTLEALPGSNLGVSLDAAGTTFRVVAPGASAVELLVFDQSQTPVHMRLGGDGEWRWRLRGVGPSWNYALRVHDQGGTSSPWLLDPYARAITGSFPNELRSVVVSDEFDWQGDRPPATPWEDTVIYEVHVKGATKLHPGISDRLRGTYGGIAHPAFVGHLTDLGVTAVELLPVQQFHTPPTLAEKGLTNYWGYDPIGFFAPHDGYAWDRLPGEQVREFKKMVRALHRAGIEVILDVVYNHTAEGGPNGPTLCHRGFDERYYRHTTTDRSDYLDLTGTGNTLDVRWPPTARMILDSLRYWVAEMHVDGFRFDQAVTLLRDPELPSPSAPMMELIRQEPVLRHVKLIAESWDTGPAALGVGHFPAGWAEWNRGFRDDVRDYWRGRGVAPALASRLTGSMDLFASSIPINMVTSHDGFTLADLVSYNVKHNEANGENNRDGIDENYSWNCGVEGPTDDPEILGLRLRQQRNLLTTLLLSQGVPMLRGGDELGQTQMGNNNAYCQDNELSWLHWEDTTLVRVVQDLLAVRRRHPQLRRLFSEVEPGQSPWSWYHPDGSAIPATDWNLVTALALRVISADVGRELLICFNPTPSAMEFTTPPGSSPWRTVGGGTALEGLLTIGSREVIVLERDPTPLTGPPVASVPEALQRLTDLQGYEGALRADGMNVFAALFRAIVANIEDGINASRFGGPEFVAALLVALANRFLAALRASAFGWDSLPAEWVPLLRGGGSPFGRVPLPLEALNVLVNFDLPAATADAFDQLGAVPLPGVTPADFEELLRVFAEEPLRLTQQAESSEQTVAAPEVEAAPLWERAVGIWNERHAPASRGPDFRVA
ncbi:MAG TPA: glycogen debranching protein GlgX [Actinomycetota bacterium]|nr:glycogen debranching protein GlgX [Actinomycetota bacterium]